MLAKLPASARELWADTRGVMLPYVTIMLVVLVSISVLAVDGARIMSLQTQLQKAADALALAGAAELDQQPTSITRATNAINNLVTNGTLAGMGNQTILMSGSPRFLRSLPASDATAIAGANITTDPLEARFVEVTVVPVTLANVLPAAAFFGGVNSKTAGALAVAGRDKTVVCGIPPVFMCNPYETAGMTNDDATEALNAAAADPASARRQFKLNASKTGPGQFGWLVPPDGCTGASCLAEWIGKVNPNACYPSGGISLNTGEKQSANAGFNARFDLWQGGNPLNAPSADYAPAVNTRKGHKWHSPNWCHADAASPYYTDPDVSGLPRDTSFTNDFMGDGVFNCLAYWQKNHVAAAPVGCTATSTISRYDVYRYEIAQNLVGDWSGNRLEKLNNGDPGTGETGAPLCAANNGVAGVDADPSIGRTDRRIIFAAVVNCLANGPFPSGSNATNVPVAGFGKFFMTQPVGVDGDPTRPIYAEMVGLATLDDGVGIIVPVQLYR